MIDALPGLRPERLLALCKRSVAEMLLDLRGTTVLTEAATGAYAVTPVLAALASAASVDAVTRSTRFGSVEQVRSETMRLAELAGVADRITIHDGLSRGLVERADVITNSGHVRPIDATMISRMHADCVVPLMFEAWEIDLGRDDVDLDALRARGIRFAGTNERHPAVDVFSYLGPMLVKLLNDAAIAVYGSRIVVLCDNPFQPYLIDGLTRVGATVAAHDSLVAADLSANVDAVVVALKPNGTSVLTDSDLATIAHRAPGAVIAQFWGDVSRDSCARLGVPCAPVEDPGVGHMGVLPSSVGPESIIRLQAGGLKVASILRRSEPNWSDDDRSYVDDC